MKITKHFLKEILNETLHEFNKKMTIIDHDVELNFINKDVFLASAIEDPLIKQQIAIGIYKNIESEYPNFLVVYFKDKNPMLKILGIPYKITLCYEMAKDILKPFDKKDVSAYLKRLFIHELTHIVEDKLIIEKPDLWNTCLMETGNNEPLAKEHFAEAIADHLTDKKAYEKIYNTIWSLVNNRVKKLRVNF